MNYPTNLQYSKSHEWIRTEDGVAVIGISDFAQHALGDVVFVNLPGEGDEVTAGEAFGDVESVKAVSDLVSPVSGTVCAVNEELLDAPELLNSQCYDAWIIKVEGVTATEELLDAAAALENRYDFENRGIMLLRIEDKLQLASRPMYGPYVRRVTESRRSPALSPAALEVLTIIAYRQTVTRAFIDQLRGVDSSNTVSSLAEKGLIEEAGRLDVPGKPMLFRTTDQFLRSFSLASIEDLPALPALEENEQMELNMDGTLHETPPGEQLRFLNGEPVPPETE